MCDTKTIVVNNICTKLRKIINRSMSQSDYNTALAAIIASANIKYLWNQEYVDEYLETQIKIISEQFVDVVGESNNWILFYDGFGLDTRGLALIYLSALVDLGYSICYITIFDGKNRQKEIDKVLLKSKEFKKIYLNSYSASEKITEILNVVNKYKPMNAFLYTNPADVAGIIAFECMRDITRYQINLTDHAFWLGKYAFDYCIEFREYGASISYYYRHIERDKIKLLPYYPYINYEERYLGLPFDKKDKKVIFSGGSLYKTIDEHATYYEIIRNILKKRENVIFLYAGNGDDSYLKNLQNDFPYRVYHIKERKDLYQLLCDIDVYINTYPLIGGLMMQYAAIAGKPPITLYSGDFTDGILLDQHNINVEFNTKEQMVDEVLHLLDSGEYRHKRALEIKKCVISHNEFSLNLKKILENKDTNYNLEYNQINTDDFIKEYRYRFSMKDIESCLINIETMALGKYFPMMFLKKFPKFILKKWRRKCKL